MNKFALHIRMALLLAGAFWLAPSIAADTDGNTDELEKVRAVVSEMFGEIEPQHIQPSPLDGWYTIRKGAIVAYISSDGRYLLQGDIIDLESQINLSENARNEARMEMMAAVPEENKIRFTPENVKYTVSVFTDIDCTYCRRLHAQIDEYMANGIEIEYMLYPRSGPASQSWVKAERVWCADDRREALTNAKVDKGFESHSCDTSMVSKHYAIGRDIGLTGTPAIIMPDGTLMPGYVPPDQLLQRLHAAEPIAAN
jgi:thiol:disulfide interchange protein DsbC